MIEYAIELSSVGGGAAVSANNLFIREVGNGTWFIMSIAIWSTIGLALIGRVNRLGFGTSRLRRFFNGVCALFNEAWYERHIGVQAAIAYFVWLTSDVIRSGYIWFLFVSQHSKLAFLTDIADDLEASYAIIHLGVAVALIGGMCCIRVFSKDTLSYWTSTWTWIGTGVAAVAVPLVVHWLFQT